MTSEEAASRVLRDRDLLAAKGGVTVSGGEPTLQPAFLMEFLDRVSGLHRAIETCGFCRPGVFGEILTHLDYVLMDLKLIDPEAHRYWTGQDNAWILENLEQVRRSRLPFVIRIPLIPGVNDTEDNLEATAELLEGAENLQYVELLPYHQTAGAKYTMVGREYNPGFDTQAPPNQNLTPFERRGLSARLIWPNG